MAKRRKRKGPQSPARKAYLRNRRAKKAARYQDCAVNDFNNKAWYRVLARFNYECAYCLKSSTPRYRPDGTRIAPSWISRDHVVPVSRGGDNTELNVVPACRRCNESKGSRLVNEWTKDWPALADAA